MRVFFLLIVLSSLSAGAEKAKNVILFLADGTGLATVNAASIHGHGKAQSLYVQQMPNIGLSETSSASNWVTDSAAGMTAIVTGQKTHNGVISQGPDAVRGVKDGEGLKTILEYAEERGLSTGVVSNSSMADATPGACYGRANDRKKQGEIFLQIVKPRYGDGVDVVIGPGRKSILAQTEALNVDLASALKERDYAFHDDFASWDASNTQRVVTLFDSDDFDLGEAVNRAVTILSRNKKGFFLMVESNNHSKSPQKDLDRLVRFDEIIAGLAKNYRKNSLLLFTADHSYDLRLPSGKKGDPVAPNMRFDGSHTGEEVLVAAEGPGAKKIRGYMKNTDLFRVMMDAYGW
ncbi:MAG: alkaline phosphatase [Bryobacteraceae bacterium]|nr:alkaline phosphatase [Bryobacteraceae bacterium]